MSLSVANLEKRLKTPMTEGSLNQENATATTASPNILTVTSSVTANTLGSYAAWDTSLSVRSQLALVAIAPPARGKSLEFRLKIATGAGGSEVIIFDMCVPYFYKTDVGYVPPVILSLGTPIDLAAGVRISAAVSDDESVANAYLLGLGMYHGYKY